MYLMLLLLLLLLAWHCYSSCYFSFNTLDVAVLFTSFCFSFVDVIVYLVVLCPSLVNVVAPLAIPCSTLLLLLLFFFQCCCFSCVPCLTCLTLLLLIQCIRHYYSSCSLRYLFAMLWCCSSCCSLLLVQSCYSCSFCFRLVFPPLVFCKCVQIQVLRLDLKNDICFFKFFFVDEFFIIHVVFEKNWLKVCFIVV